jgi:3-oxoadipate enol-lactonase
VSTIVFVHALGSSSGAWAPQVRGLSDRHRVLAVDLPGHGDAAGPFTLTRAVERVRAAIDEADDRAHVVGISGGAVVALLTYLEHSTRVSSLVLSGGFAQSQPMNLAPMPARLPSRPDELPDSLACLRHSRPLSGARPFRTIGRSPTRRVARARFVRDCGRRPRARTARPRLSLGSARASA